MSILESERKPTRLKGFRYASAGSYFITQCVLHKEHILSTICTGDDAHIVPKNDLSHIGKICEKYILNISKSYTGVSVDHYVIMPNHIHLLLTIQQASGTMWASSPTKGIPDIMRSLKTMVSKEVGKSIWQRSYYDHIIRNENDYLNVWNYIDTNVARWKNDDYYSEKKP